MEEKKMLSDEELKNVSGGRLVTKQENCGKWWKCISSRGCYREDSYAYIRSCDGSSYTATVYFVGNDKVYAPVLYITPTELFAIFREIDVSGVPEAIRQAAGC